MGIDQARGEDLTLSRFFGDAVHAAYVVPDIQVAMQSWLELGCGPIYLMDRVRPDARYRGVSNNPCISAAILNSGSMQIELIQQHDATPSAYTEFLARTPQGGIHHLAYWVEDFAAIIARAAEHDVMLDVVQEFVEPDGTAFEIYVERAGRADPLLAQLMLNGPSKALYDGVRDAARNWDGATPIRDALELLGSGLDLHPEKT